MTIQDVKIEFAGQYKETNYNDGEYYRIKVKVLNEWWEYIGKHKDNLSLDKALEMRDKIKRLIALDNGHR